MKNDFFEKKMQFFPLPPPSECPLRGVAAALRPAEVTDGSPPPPADVPLIESFFFTRLFRLCPSISPGRPADGRAACRPPGKPASVVPYNIIGVGQSADCLHSPLLRPFLPTDAVSRSKRHRGTLETPYPGPKQILRRWKCRIFNLTKHFDARYDISLTFINILALDTSYP